MNISLNTLLLLLQVLAVVSTGGMVLFKLGSFTKGIGASLIRLNEIFASHTADDQAVFTRITAELGSVRDKVEKIGEALTTIAVQREQIGGLRAEVAALRAELADLRHGRGFAVEGWQKAPPKN